MMEIIQHEQLILLNDFPLLVPIRDDFTEYDGFIDIGGEEVWINVTVPNYPKLSKMSIRCSEKQQSFLKKQQRNFKSWTQECSSLHDFLSRFRELMENQLSEPEPASSLKTLEFPSSEVYEKLITDLTNVGLSNVIHVSNNIDEIQLKCVDIYSREHILTLKTKENSRDYLMTAELPQKAMTKSQASSMVSCYRTFVKQVNNLQEFWNALDEIDEHCWVTDPELPNRTHNYRRINIGSNISVQVTLDHLNMARPDIRVLGSLVAIQPYTDALARSFAEEYILEPNASIVSYLLDCLGLPCFPSKPEEQDEADGLVQLVLPDECSICYLTRLDDGEMPDVACDSVKCARQYHSSCLFQWLDSLQNPIRYNRIHGNCPNCNESISCVVSFSS